VVKPSGDRYAGSVGVAIGSEYPGWRRCFLIVVKGCGGSALAMWNLLDGTLTAWMSRDGDCLRGSSLCVRLCGGCLCDRCFGWERCFLIVVKGCGGSALAMWNLLDGTFSAGVPITVHLDRALRILVSGLIRCPSVVHWRDSKRRLATFWTDD